MSDSVARRDDYLGLVVAGYVMSFVLPIGGMVTAFVLGERRLGHAVAMVFISGASGWLWLWTLFGL